MAVCLILLGKGEVQAAASFGGEVGRFIRSAADDRDIYTLATGISAGKRAVALLGWEATSDQGVSEVRDSKGNVWTIDATMLNFSVHQMATASAFITNALGPGDTITVIYTSAQDSDRAATIVWLDGVLEGPPNAVYQDGHFNTDVLDTITTSKPGTIIIGHIQAQQAVSDTDNQQVTYTNSIFQLIGASMDFGYDPGSTVGLRHYMFWDVTTDAGIYSPGGTYLEGGQPHDEGYSLLMVAYEADTNPKLILPAKQEIDEQTPLSVSPSVINFDGLGNLLTFELVSPPEGMTIDAATGAISWTPSESQAPSTNEISVGVSILGILNLSLSGSFQVVVNEVNTAPNLTLPPNQIIDELTPLSVFVSATDSDIPTNTLTFDLVTGPAGMTVGAVTGEITWIPSESQGPGTNLVTVKVTDNGAPNLTTTGTFQVIVNEVNTTPTLTLPANQTIDVFTTLNVFASATDHDVPTNALSFGLVSFPVGLTIDASTGEITWTPTEGQGASTNEIIVSVTDDGAPNLTATGSFQVVVNEVNTAPVLSLPSNQEIDELTPLNVFASATDNSVTGNALTFGLVSPPSGMMIDASTGAIAWTPSEAQGPSTNQITVTVTDNGVPNLTTTGSFEVVVKEANTAPMLTLPANQVIDELTTLNVVASATDADQPANALTFTLVSPPAGMTIDAVTGAIRWTPSEAQGPSTNQITVTVTDNGVPNLSATGSFQVVVKEANTAPSLTLPADQVIDELTTINVFANATDADLPANALAFALVSPPAGMTIDAVTGAIRWTPSEAQGPSTNQITVTVTDNGVPNLSATGSFQVVVKEANTAPSLTLPADQVIDELTTLNVVATATDADQPANALTFALVSPPAGMTIDTITGAIVWTPSEAQGPSTNEITVTVTDNGAPNLTATGSFQVVVREVNTAPSLTLPADQVIDELTTLNVLASATDSDLPVNALTFGLVAPPAGMTIDASSGAISWTPSETQGPSTNTITVFVRDLNSAASIKRRLSVTNTFVVQVNEVNTAPRLTLPSNQTIDESTPLSVFASATDADQPANALTFSLVSPPVGMTIDANTGAIAWTPTEAQGPSTNQITVSVTDNGVPNLTANGSFQVVVNEVNTAPHLTLPSNQTIDELTPLNVFASATDSDQPANALTFALVSPPAGMTIDAITGAIAWTPSEAQGPSTNQITVTVTDNGAPNLTATGSFQMVIKEVNTAPSLKAPPNATLLVGELYSAVASMTDADLPPNSHIFSLSSGPQGLTVSASGEISWSTTNVAPGEYQISIHVDDDGIPSLGDTATFTISVQNGPQLTLDKSSTQNSLTWTAKVGATYRVQFKDDLNVGSWNDLPGDITAEAGTALKIDDSIASDNSRFYRIVEIQP